MSPGTVMGKAKHKKTSTFNLEGRFLTFLVKDGHKIKALQLATAEGEYTIKLTKEARASIGKILVPGDWIQVSGQQQGSLKKGKRPKLKARSIQPKAPNRSQSFPLPAAKATSGQAKILVCQKSACRKRGANGICQALAANLSERGLADQVTIKGTGCMDRCKAGPNLVVMPDKTRYSRVSPQEIPELLDKHLHPSASEVADKSSNLPQTQEILDNHHC